LVKSGGSCRTGPRPRSGRGVRRIPKCTRCRPQVDRQRFDVLYETAFEILHSERHAQLFASWATYLLIGYEQGLVPRDEDAFAWAVDRLTEALYSGSFAGVPSD
jgi:hypothetical protein